MRVAWVIHGDLAQPTGGYVYDRLVIDGLRVHGDEVHVLGVGLARSLTARPPILPRRGRSLTARPRVLPRRGRNLGSDVERESLLSRIVRERVPVVVGDALCVGELAPAFELLAGKTTRILLVHHLASWELERTDSELLRAIEVRAVVASDGLVATSAATAARIQAQYPGRTVEVVLPGADRLPRHPRTARADGRIALLFVGGVIARKRLSLLLDALEQLADPRVSLTLLGDADREPEYTRAIAARVAASPGLVAAVAAPRVVDDDTLARRMASSHALVLPSSLEGYGMVLTEALRAGLPVLASREAAHAAGLESSGAVLVFDDAPGLANALGCLVQDASLYRAMQRAAEHAVLPRWEGTVSAFRDAIERLVQRVAPAFPR